MKKMLIIVCLLAVLFAVGLRSYNKFLVKRYDIISARNERIAIYREFNALDTERWIKAWNNNENNITDIVFDLGGEE